MVSANQNFAKSNWQLSYFYIRIKNKSGQKSSKQAIMKVEDENGTISTCEECGSSPCEREEIKTDNETQGESFHSKCRDGDGCVENAKVRKCLYQYYTYWKLGKAGRIPIPICVTEKIRELWPSDDYMGYKSS